MWGIHKAIKKETIAEGEDRTHADFGEAHFENQSKDYKYALLLGKMKTPMSLRSTFFQFTPISYHIEANVVYFFYRRCTLIGIKSGFL